jgi:RNA-directed DNA polymerase
VCSFDSMDHDWTLRFLQHRVGDKRLLRLIRKWLKVGVAEDGKRVEQEIGAPQGAVISPILANIYLHYVYDLWINQWRKHNATGDIIVIRYADDTILGFQYKRDADSLLKLLESRLAGFSLSLHPAKTRLLQFGRYAQERKRLIKHPSPDHRCRDRRVLADWQGQTRNLRFSWFHSLLQSCHKKWLV